MSAHPARWIPIAAITALAALAGCGGGDDEEVAAPATTITPSEAPRTITAPPDPPPAPAPPSDPLPGLPRFTAGYEGWDRLNAAPLPPDSAQARRVGFDAHRGTKNIHVNVGRARLEGAGGAQRFPYPDGTILVKAAGEDPASPTLVAVMRKIAGSDAEHGDWEFVEYKRSGPGEPFASSPGLRDATCWGCHAIAMETDWAFTTLE